MIEIGKRMIAHEAPIQFFDFVQDRTDYDYCLAHLYQENERYREKFKEAKSKGRTIILDTSVFELGEALDFSLYFEIVKDLKPAYYMLPDVLEDSVRTTTQARQWMLRYVPLLSDSKPIGVVQGKTYSEIRGCYEYLDKELNLDMIAISFDYSYYRQTNPHSNKLVSWMLGRVTLLNQLLQDGVINTAKPHHLLGTALPLEGMFYNVYEYPWITSVDTSNPVLHAVLGHKYLPNLGMKTKISQKLYELIDQEVTDPLNCDIIVFNMEHNISEFEKYWKHAFFH